jgi:hypothetical protein
MSAIVGLSTGLLVGQPGVIEGADVRQEVLAQLGVVPAAELGVGEDLAEGNGPQAEAAGPGALQVPEGLPEGDQVGVERGALGQGRRHLAGVAGEALQEGGVRAPLQVPV